MKGPDNSLYFIAYGKSENCQDHDSKQKLQNMEFINATVKQETIDGR